MREVSPRARIVLSMFLNPSKGADLLAWALDAQSLLGALTRQVAWDKSGSIETLLMEPHPEADHPGRHELELLLLELARGQIAKAPKTHGLDRALAPIESGSLLSRRVSALAVPGALSLDCHYGFVDLLLYNPDTRPDIEASELAVRAQPNLLRELPSLLAPLGIRARALGVIEPEQWDDYPQRAALIQSLLERDSLGSATQGSEGSSSESKGRSRAL